MNSNQINSSSAKPSKARGYIVYDGPSRIDGSPILGIVTTVTTNPKTGPMSQLWIVLKDKSPVDAVKDGTDKAVCGDCPMHDGCYVLAFQGPRSVWQSYQSGKYPIATKRDLAKIKSQPVRLGAYGDPCALPITVLRSLFGDRGVTGYTHQWRNEENSAYSAYLMASTETDKDDQEAIAKGFRPFRIIAPNAPTPSYPACPADRGISCAECMACGGNSSRPSKGRWVRIHGNKAKRALHILQ